MRTLVGLVAMAAAAFAPFGDAQGRGDSSREEVVRRLETMKVSVDFRDVSLAEALDYLREVTGLNLILLPRATEQGGDAKIRLKARDLSVKSTLKLLLASKGLTVTYRDGALVVLPQEDLQDNLVAEMYDVRSQLMKLQDFPGPRMELVSSKQGDTLKSGVFLLETEKDPPVTPEFLFELVRENTGGRSWEKNASIELKNGILFVSQSPAVHRQIKDLLAKLAQFR
jgi:hypothetical protein